MFSKKAVELQSVAVPPASVPGAEQPLEEATALELKSGGKVEHAIETDAVVAVRTSYSKQVMCSTPLRFFKGMMRSHSDSAMATTVFPFPPNAMATAEEEESKDEEEEDNEDDDQEGLEELHETEQCTIEDVDAPPLATEAPSSEYLPAAESYDVRGDSLLTNAAATDPASSALCDTFLNASLQLLHLQSDARQRIRQLWFTVQRLRWEHQLSEAGVDLLHMELLAVVKSLNIEKLDGTRYLKSGYLTLVQSASPSNKPAMRALFGARPMGQRTWCTLAEDQATLELTPVREEPSISSSTHTSEPHTKVPTAAHAAATSHEVPPPPIATGATPPSTTASPVLSPTGMLQSITGAASNFSKFKLPSSISSLLADPFQSGEADAPTARTIKLHGAQVRQLAPADDDKFQFQLLVPVRREELFAARGESVTTGHNVFTLDAASEEVRNAWVTVLERVCMFHLYLLEKTISDVVDHVQYRQALASHFPVCISLAWLRNRIDRQDQRQGQSLHQQQLHQHQQVQRRSSRNLSMIQIIKDLERDKILVDHKLISCVSKTNALEQDNISEVVKYMVGKVMAFVKHANHRAKAAGNNTPTTTAEPFNRDSPLPPSSHHKSLSSTSPVNRFNRHTEAKALAFVERVLRGSSRTQSGGDIYDAISFLCQHQHVSICPVSHDAYPVQLNILGDDVESMDDFQVEVQVCMRFKIVELNTSTPMTSSLCENEQDGEYSPTQSRAEGPTEWACVEGTLTRLFTLGKLSEPGTVTVSYLDDESTAG